MEEKRRKALQLLNDWIIQLEKQSQIQEESKLIDSRGICDNERIK